MRGIIWKEVGVKILIVVSILFLMFLSVTVSSYDNLDEGLYKELVVESVENQFNTAYIEADKSYNSTSEADNEGYLLRIWEVDEYFKGVIYMRYGETILIISLVYDIEIWYVDYIAFDGFVYEFHGGNGFQIDVDVLKEGLKQIRNEDLEFLKEA